MFAFPLAQFCGAVTCGPRRYAWLLAITSVLGQASTAPAQDDAVQRLMSEGPKAWDAYRTFLATLQGKSDTQETIDGAPGYHSEASVLQKPRCAMFVRQGRAGDAGQKEEAARGGWLWACNPAYAFELRRKREDAPWRVTNTSLRDEPSADEPNVAHPYQDMTVKSLTWLITLRGVPLNAVISHASFRVARSERVIEEGAPCLRFHFECVHPIDSRPFFPIQRGSMTLDPARSWCVRAAELECLYAAGVVKSRIVTQLRDSSRGFPIPVSRIEDGTARDGNRTIATRRVDTIELEERPTWPDDSEFTLSAFGFPEPSGIGVPATRRVVPIWLWVAIGGGTLLVLAVGASWLKSRAAARS